MWIKRPPAWSSYPPAQWCLQRLSWWTAAAPGRSELPGRTVGPAEHKSSRTRTSRWWITDLTAAERGRRHLEGLLNRLCGGKAPVKRRPRGFCFWPTPFSRRGEPRGKTPDVLTSGWRGPTQAARWCRPWWPLGCRSPADEAPWLWRRGPMPPDAAINSAGSEHCWGRTPSAGTREEKTGEELPIHRGLRLYLQFSLNEKRSTLTCRLVTVKLAIRRITSG